MTEEEVAKAAREGSPLLWVPGNTARLPRSRYVVRVEGWNSSGRYTRVTVLGGVGDGSGEERLAVYDELHHVTAQDLLLLGGA